MSAAVQQQLPSWHTMLFRPPHHMTSLMSFPALCHPHHCVVPTPVSSPPLSRPCHCGVPTTVLFRLSPVLPPPLGCPDHHLCRPHHHPSSPHHSVIPTPVSSPPLSCPHHCVIPTTVVMLSTCGARTPASSTPLCHPHRHRCHYCCHGCHTTRTGKDDRCYQGLSSYSNGLSHGCTQPTNQ